MEAISETHSSTERSLPVLHPRSLLVEIRLAHNVRCGIDLLRIRGDLVTANQAAHQLAGVLFSVNVVHELSIV